QAKLTGHEKQAFAAKPTNNPEAYDAYLRGLSFQARTGQSIHLALKTIGYLSRRCSLTPILRLPGRTFLARTRISTLNALTPLARSSQRCFGTCAETSAKLARDPSRPGLLSILGITGLRTCQSYLRPRQQAPAR